MEQRISACVCLPELLQGSPHREPAPRHRSPRGSVESGPATPAQESLWSCPSVSALATLLSLIPQGNGLCVLILQALAGTEPST